MSKTGRFWDQLETAFGKGNVTSGYRSQEEQDALVRRGVTKATKSSHTYEDGYDISVNAAKSEADVRRIASQHGLPIAKVIRETGVGRNQGTGPHWHIEIGDNKMASKNGAGGAYNSSQPGQGVANPAAYLADLESALGPEKAASQNVKQNSEATFKSDAELKSRANAVEGQMVKQGQQLDVLDQALQVAHSAAKEAMTRQVDQTRNISNEIVSGTQELKDKVMPIFKARGRVADQLDKLATMNPLERGIRGIFDLNYDADYLEGQLDQFDRTLKARSDDFDYLNKLHGVALQEVERRYSMDTAIPALMQKQVEEDLGLTGMRIQQTAGMLGSLRDRISTESQLISAKALARNDLLNRLDTPTMTDLMTQAEQNGGVVQFNGVEFSARELREQISKGEQQELSTEAFKMSIASGRMEMAEKFAVNLARSLTRPQIEAAMANGGVHNGVQLPQDVLSESYKSMVQRDSVMAETVANNLPATVALQTATSYMNQATGLYQRTKGMFGHEAVKAGAPYLTQGSALVRQLVAATESGQPPEVITALTQKIAANSEEYSKLIDKQILDQVGGDKRAAGYLRGFVNGAQLSPGTAAEALTYFAIKGNLPEGVAVSPEAKQVFQKAQTLVIQHRNDKVNGKPISEEGLMGIVQRELTGAAAKIMGQARHDSLWSDMPRVASAAQHPFGKFDPARWQQIRSEAALTAAESIAKTLNTTPQNVLTIMRTGNPATDDEAGKQLLAATQKAAAQFNGVEFQTTVSLLDNEKQIQPGRRNSSILSDFLSDPKFSTGIKTYGKSLASQSMAEYLVNPLITGATEGNFLKTRQNVLDAQAAIHQTARQMAQNPASNVLFQPVERANITLSAIPGIGREGAKLLIPEITKAWNQNPPDRSQSGPGLFRTQLKEDDARIYQYLTSVKFENPTMETYRKLAVKNWNDHSARTMGTIESVADTIGLAISSNSPF